ncbi:MAG: alpha/beta hydrolase [Lachnospiraceae bacterium]|nr:alpha/beta hydrolase [Lachnospiraceae bacterium]
MFTTNDTFMEIMNTEPVRRAIGNLFPSNWTSCIAPKHSQMTMEQIQKEDRLEWGGPFPSGDFVRAANLLLTETAENHRFLFIPLWRPAPDNNTWIPDADLNTAEGVWLFTGNPKLDNQAFAHTAAADTIPPFPSTAVPPKKHKQHRRPAVILCPGGGYMTHSAYREGIELAERMERDGGYKAFILRYRLSPHGYPLPQMDLALAILHVRAHADIYDIDPARIFAVGASAGGHLCASEALWHEDLKQLALTALKEESPQNNHLISLYQNSSARPDGLGLLYPVVSFLSDCHEGSCINNTKGDPRLRQLLSVDQHISPDYPLTYAFANADDDCVPVSNTVRLKEALDRAGIPHLCQIFPTGGHGVGLGYSCSCQTWSEDMLAFFAPFAE